MFPGYLFARFVYFEFHRAVRHAFGVSTILHFGELVPKMDDALIGTLRSSHPGGEMDLVIIEPELAPGSAVTVASGVFAGLETLVTQVLPAKSRIRILLEILGQQVEAEIERREVVFPNRMIRVASDA